jgi:hypothetical protein
MFTLNPTVPLRYPPRKKGDLFVTREYLLGEGIRYRKECVKNGGTWKGDIPPNPVLAQKLEEAECTRMVSQIERGSAYFPIENCLVFTEAGQMSVISAQTIRRDSSGHIGAFPHAEMAPDTDDARHGVDAQYMEGRDVNDQVCMGNMI